MGCCRAGALINIFASLTVSEAITLVAVFARTGVAWLSVSTCRGANALVVPVSALIVFDAELPRPCALLGRRAYTLPYTSSAVPCIAVYVLVISCDSLESPRGGVVHDLVKTGVPLAQVSVSAVPGSAIAGKAARGVDTDFTRLTGVGKRVTLINVSAGTIRPSFVAGLAAGALIAPLGVGAGGVLLAIIPAGVGALINIGAGEAVAFKAIVTIAGKTTAGVGAGRLRVAGVLSRVLALIHIAAKRPGALVAVLTRAGETTRRVGADPVGVTVVEIFRALININAARSTEDVPHPTHAGPHAGVGLVVVAVVTGLSRIGHPIPARRLHAGAATRVRGCV